jgi:hypothetical protein
MSRMASAMVGSSVLAAACRIPSSVVVRDTPKRLAQKPNEAFPRESKLDFIHLVIEQCQQTPSAVIYETSFWRSIRNRDIQKLPLLENQEFMSDGSSVLRAWIKSS